MQTSNVNIPIVDFPMLLVYMYASLTLGCLVIFLVAYLVGKDIRNDVIAPLSYRTTKQSNMLQISVVS